MKECSSAIRTHVYFIHISPLVKFVFGQLLANNLPLSSSFRGTFEVSLALILVARYFVTTSLAQKMLFCQQK